MMVGLITWDLILLMWYFVFKIRDHDFWIRRTEFDLDINFRCDPSIFPFFFFSFFFTFFWRFSKLGIAIFEFVVLNLIFASIFVAIWAFFVFSSFFSFSFFLPLPRQFLELGTTIFEFAVPNLICVPIFVENRAFFVVLTKCAPPLANKGQRVSQCYYYAH